MINILIAGDSAKDINQFMCQKNKDNIVINNGGACYYASVGASLFNSCGVVSKIGDDFDINSYRKLGVDCAGIKNITGQTTQFHHVFLSEDGQMRNFKAYRNIQSNLNITDFPINYLKEAKIIFITTTLPKQQLELITSIRKVSSAMIAVDTLLEFSSDSITKAVFDLADIAFIDEEFSSLLSSKADIRIIKHGKYGCEFISNAQNIIYKNEDIVKNVVDKTGAGDIMAGCFLSLYSKTNNPKLSLTFSNIIATESVKMYGVDELTNAPKVQKIKKYIDN